MSSKNLSEERKAAILLGMKEGDDKVDQFLATGIKSINGWKIGSFIGNRDFYHGDWLMRAAAAKGGIYGNDAVEATYPLTRTRMRTAKRIDGSRAQLHADLCRWAASTCECFPGR